MKRANKTYLVPMPDGSQRRLGLVNKVYDPVPDAYVDGQPLLLAKKLEAWEYIVACLPLMLVFAGGLIGGGVGAVATLINVSIMRRDQPVGVRVGLCVGVGVLAFIIVALLSGLVYAALST